LKINMAYNLTFGLIGLELPITELLKEARRMPRYDSSRWDWQNGVCRRHFLPQVPCPACIAEHDEDLEVLFEEGEEDAILFESLFPDPLSKED